METNSKLKIAVVDDDTSIADLYCQIIEKLGYAKPAVFHNGTSLVKAMALDRLSFDVIIMDYRMPEMNGIEAAKIIQRYKKDTKIVIATAYDLVKEKASAAGLPLLLKPFSTEQLSECLSDLEKNPVSPVV